MNTPQKATYTCTALVGTNKVGILKPDTDGYYHLCVGALNSYNSIGAYYPLDTAKHAFESSGSLMRRIQTGNCKGEVGHPKRLPGQSYQQYLQRVLSIEETQVCCHFKEITLEHNGYKDKEGRPVVAIMGQVRPTGPHGDALARALENKHENVCFSLRSLSMDHFDQTGTLIKNIRTIVTFDWVTEPGISTAMKWNAPGLESLEEMSFTPEHLVQADTPELDQAVGFEQHQGLNLIQRELGWDRPQSTRPPSIEW